MTASNGFAALDALAKNQASRAALFSSLITRTGHDQAS